MMSMMDEWNQALASNCVGVLIRIPYSKKTPLPAVEGRSQQQTRLNLSLMAQWSQFVWQFVATIGHSSSAHQSSTLTGSAASNTPFLGSKL
jgi:hypothetical protein